MHARKLCAVALATVACAALTAAAVAYASGAWRPRPPWATAGPAAPAGEKPPPRAAPGAGQASPEREVPVPRLASVPLAESASQVEAMAQVGAVPPPGSVSADGPRPRTEAAAEREAKGRGAPAEEDGKAAALTGYEVVELENTTVPNFTRRTAECPSGKRAVTGGAEARGEDAILVGSFPADDGTGWVGMGRQNDYSDVGISVFVVCADVT
ncbi:hypothetical protein [Sphaerisporangium sp. TRM90804]|uniref:hypothetical protein n=1 Tax=Sphaerisporangium sp. TRM90804 TaxID=3031113 RepID=UPI00244CD211|nr:hypothetical protein [Sphaerisporangium sp. TRM90804]MDH2426272.1 hypothetical protein [Sphaerisporangium sp. TRM90804]